METISIIMNVVFILTVIPITYLFKKSYPKDINSLIGYRTKKSMESQENWLFANKFSSDLLFKCALFLPVVQIISYLLFGAKIALMGVIALWVLILLGTIILTEKKLKKLH